MRAAFLSGTGQTRRDSVLSVLPGALAEPDVRVLWSERGATQDAALHGASFDGASSDGASVGLNRVLCRSFGALVEARPDLIIAEDFGMATLQAIAYRSLRRRTRLLLWVTKPPRTGPWSRFVMSRVDGVLAHAEAAAAVALLGMPTARVFPLGESHDEVAPHAQAVIPNQAHYPDKASVDEAIVPDHARTPEQAHRLVYAGDLEPQAGVADILVSAASWAEQHPGRTVEIWWIGEGSLRGVLEAQPLPENVAQHFLGGLGAEETDRALAQCGILVVPTLVNDRHPMLAEAMSLGLPVLGSLRSRKVRDWVREGDTGWLFDPLVPEQISAALASALDTPAARLDRMRTACHARVAAMSPHGLADRLERAVTAVLRDTLAVGRASMGAG